MNLIDSSLWIEYLTNSKYAAYAEKLLHRLDDVLVPSIVIYEVFRQLSKKIDEKEALFATTQMRRAQVIVFDDQLALTAAELSLKYSLGTADSIIYATGVTHDATLFTLDNDFRKLPNCKVLAL